MRCIIALLVLRVIPPSISATGNAESNLRDAAMAVLTKYLS